MFMRKKEPRARNLTSHMQIHYLHGICIYLQRFSIFIHHKICLFSSLFIFLDILVKTVGCLNNWKLYWTEIRIAFICLSQVPCLFMPTYTYTGIYRYTYEIHAQIEELNHLYILWLSCIICINSYGKSHCIIR